jgi:putative ABC transport system permease protein
MEKLSMEVMHMSPVNTLLTALRGLVANKLRAFLTALGIIIGVASIIVMLALGNGARTSVENSFRFLGSDSVSIVARAQMDRGQRVEIGEVLSYEDGLLMPEEVELIRFVEMRVGGIGKVRNDRVILDMETIGTTAEALQTLVENEEMQPIDWPQDQPLAVKNFIEEGRFFTPSEVLAGADVCVLGFETADELFEGGYAIGASIWVNRQKCLVIGVMAELETVDSQAALETTLNQALYMPISTVVIMLYEDEPSISITARISDESRMDEAKLEIATYLRGRHNIELDINGDYEDDFNITSRDDILGAQQEAASTFSLLLTAMAIVSLVVGGIGIMNVMLVSVTERTREIGVRMALGARQRDVIYQFLLEAILISAAAGVLGIAVGTLLIPLAANLNQGIALLAPKSIPLSFSLAILTGVIFGSYPAIRASLLNPIEALHHE